MPTINPRWYVDEIFDSEVEDPKLIEIRKNTRFIAKAQNNTPTGIIVDNFGYGAYLMFGIIALVIVIIISKREEDNMTVSNKTKAISKDPVIGEILNLP